MSIKVIDRSEAALPGSLTISYVAPERLFMLEFVFPIHCSSSFVDQAIGLFTYWRSDLHFDMSPHSGHWNDFPDFPDFPLRLLTCET